MPTGPVITRSDEQLLTPVEPFRIVPFLISVAILAVAITRRHAGW